VRLFATPPSRCPAPGDLKDLTALLSELQAASSSRDRDALRQPSLGATDTTEGAPRGSEGGEGESAPSATVCEVLPITALGLRQCAPRSRFPVYIHPIRGSHVRSTETLLFLNNVVEAIRCWELPQVTYVTLL